MTGKSRHNRDETIIEAIARGENQTAAARIAGCSARTVQRRLEDDAFVSRIERFRNQMLDAAAGKVGAAVDLAISTLTQLMAESAPPAVRLGAARSVCEFALRVRESVSWERRIAELEARAASPNWKAP